jgi:hypothetical protein
MKVFTVERNRSIKLKHSFLNTCLCELSCCDVKNSLSKIVQMSYIHRAQIQAELLFLGARCDYITIHVRDNFT